MIQIGTAFQVRGPYHGLVPNLPYQLVTSLHETNTVLLALFGKHKSYEVLLARIDRDAFEFGLTTGDIFKSDRQFALPLHLRNFEGVNFSEMDMDRYAAKKSNTERVRERLNAIQPLLDRELEILRSPNPKRLINQYARGVHLQHDSSGRSRKQLNASRIRYWFFAYICHGRNIWSLMPAFVNNGNWDRDEKFDRDENSDRDDCAARAPRLRSGPNSKLPESKRSVVQSPNMNTMIVSGYNKHARVGKSMAEIYSDFLAYDVRAIAIENADGQKELLCPDQTPVPTIDQFTYRIKKAYGLPGIRKAKYGSHKYRRRFAEQLGSFSENLANIMERCEEDAEYSKARPAGLINAEPIDPLVTTRGVDVLTGFQYALGFGYAKEDNQAYNDMMFCASIDKVEFCELYGMTITSDRWPSIGLPQHRVSDRGPGMRLELNRHDSKTGMLAGTVLREITPSGQGQSKASVETTNEKIPKLEGPSTQLVSNLTPIQMIRRDISRLIEANHRLDVSARMTPEMKAMGVRSTPIGLWKWYSDRARTRAQLISYDEAVRRYLRKVDVMIDRDGAYLKYQRYTSKELSKTGLLERIGDIGRQHVTGYVLSMCVRYIVSALLTTSYRA